ncbi:GNAT family N-acetyltransferase [Vulgatibacter sp.]|uniref:GNAT family N-acetyltransferase n=1 Tax=Vulgatibacter sp. TaxID=1971226 RepID=UPI003561CCA2
MIEIRDAAPLDYAAFARLFPALGPEFAVPDEAQWQGGMFADAIVAEDGQGVAGYVLGVPFGTVGHVSQLVVDEGRRRAGLGRRLMAAMGERLRARGCTSWQLNVKRENVAACRLYEGLGFRHASTCSWITLTSAIVETLPAAAVQARPIDPADDAAIDRAFGLREGNMAWGRTFAGNVLHEVVDAAGVRQGFGIYMQGTRFVVLLRLLRPDLLRPLLASFGAGATEDVRVAVEENDELRDVLLARGGRLDLETDRLVAPLAGAAR